MKRYLQILSSSLILATLCSCASQPLAPVIDKGKYTYSKDVQPVIGINENSYKPYNTSEEIQTQRIEPITTYSHSTTQDAQSNQSTSGYLVSKKKLYVENPEYKARQEEFKADKSSSIVTNNTYSNKPIEIQNQPSPNIASTKSKAIEERPSEAIAPRNDDNEYNVRYKGDLTYDENEEAKKTSSHTSDFHIASPLNLPNFAWPLKGKILARFGKHGNKFNEGINIQAAAGTPISAAADGKVVYIGNNIEGYGNLLILKHVDNIMTAYAHVKDITVDRGSQVNKGDNIATVGQTGNVSQPQLHFSIRKGKKTINPEEPL
jgi:murein DD-endopeptidase MepM/ murein hydrolase activator NlpD